ncbi:hypothetical protein E2320_003556 [Naja naja]|nr:hypothetical protein E2320_003556 [Naja naja]
MKGRSKSSNASSPGTLSSNGWQNCILADEMGLGKTIQSIAFLEEVYNVGIRGPFLVIAPLSTITNWEREFNTWTEMNTIVYHGSLASRQMIQQYEMYCKDSRGRLIPGAYKFDALITTFEMILSDCPELREIEWRCVIIDEAHRLKNRNCKLLDSLKHMDLNTVEELFSLLHFLEPSQFPSESEFLKDFGDLKTEEQVQKLQAILKPMMLRRLKEDVEKNLAPKQETIIEVELTNIQKKYYRAILEKNFNFLSKGAGHSNMPNLLNTMMELRKCCNHPYLINGAEEKILTEFRDSCHHHVPHDFPLQAMVRSSGKLVLIDKLLPKLKAGGHKVLIFSQMRIDGRVRGNLRQAAIDRFSKPDSDRFVFLLCTRAGGLGINLTAADTCIIFDSDWNPQNDLQAQARCHRIGQSKAVKVYRLITRNSYEREMFDKASLKLGLDKAVLQSMSGREGSITGIQQFSKKEIEDLLRKGAYAAIMEEDDEGSKFCEEDIDQILLRRTTTITIESEGKGSTFAKASFVASENRTDIALDDPNFWQKWAKKADLDLDLLNSKNNLVIDTPRIRKQTRHFSTLKDDDLVEFSDLESDDDDRPRSRRHDRHHHPLHHSYGRTDCFQVEKQLLVYGEILSHGRFKRRMSERDVETICRAILVYCLMHYRAMRISKDSSGTSLARPVHPGSTGPQGEESQVSDHVRSPESRVDQQVQPGHSLPRRRLQETSQAPVQQGAAQGPNALLLASGGDRGPGRESVGSETDIWFPLVDQAEVPTAWWDTEADKSLLLGVFKHGYEKYNTMRADPALCFLEKAGRPDDKAIAAEHRPDGEALMMMDEDISVVDGEEGQPGNLFWPPASALTARLRRLITAFQRSYKREQLKMEAAERGDRRRRRCEAAFKLKEMVRREKQQRWTRREQSDFYRVVSTFGVEYDPDTMRFHWSRFRTLARLDKKTDESLAKYFHGFVAMCRQVCRLPPAASDESPDPTLFIEPITEERASRTLYRIDLLRRLREQVLCHPLLEERLALCQPAGPEMPPWWQCGRHDGELLRGVARHGLSQTDTTIIQDPDFSFLAARLSHLHSRAGGTGTPPLPPPGPAQPTGLPLPGISMAAAPSPLLLAPPLNEPPAPPPQPLALPPKPESAEDSDSELDLSKISASSSCSSSSACSDDSEGEEASCGGKLFEEEESSLLSLPTSHEGNSPQPKGIKLTFQKHKLVPNGTVRDRPALTQKKSSKKMVECLEALRGPDIDLEAHIPVVNKTDGTLLVGDAAPRRADLEVWLQAHPEYAVDPRFLAYMEERRKHRWPRFPKPVPIEPNCLVGLERMQVAGISANGKKGFLPDPTMNRLLPGAVGADNAQKRGRQTPMEFSNMMALMGAGRVQLGTAGPLSLHHHAHFQTTPAHGSALQYMQFPTSAAAAAATAATTSGTLLHPGLGHAGYAAAPLHLGHPQRVDEDDEEDEMDDLSQGYASSERDFSLLDDDPMMPANSDSSDEGEEEGED